MNEDNLLKVFGKRVAYLRKSKGFTQKQLAAQVGVSVVAIAYIETGKRWPRLLTLNKIAKTLKVKTEDLFEGL